MVAIGRSLLIFSEVTFKMAAWWPYWIFWFPDSNFSLALNINSKLKWHNISPHWSLDPWIENRGPQKTRQLCRADPRSRYPWRTGTHYPIPSENFQIFMKKLSICTNLIRYNMSMLCLGGASTVVLEKKNIIKGAKIKQTKIQGIII